LNDAALSKVQGSQYGAGVFLNTVGSYDVVRITNKEYLDNVWHRFGFFAPLGILADDASCACARTCLSNPKKDRKRRMRMQTDRR
jgi:hypothetical protein